MNKFFAINQNGSSMNYTPRTLDEIIAGDEAYQQTNDYLNKTL